MASTKTREMIEKDLQSVSVINAVPSLMTERHAHVLRGVAWGMTSGEIGEWLGMPLQTVELHVAQALEKIGARNVADAVRIMLMSGFDIEADPRPELAEKVNYRQHIESEYFRRSPATDNRMTLLAETAPQDGSRSTDRISDPPRSRIVGTIDATFGERVAWIGAWTKVEQSLTYNHWDTRLLSQLDSSFDMLVVHGSRPKRLLNFVRESRRCYQGKLIVVVLTASVPEDRSAVLRAGADAVFDLDDDTEFARAWLSRAIARSSAANSSQSLAPKVSTLTALLEGVRFTPMEKGVLSTIEANAGHIVRYEELTSLTYGTDSILARRSLHVMISRIREKLGNEPPIRSIRGEGYMISLSELALAILIRTRRNSPE